MQERVKLTKRQIKEDKFTAFMLNSKHQFEENWQYMAIVAVIVILAVAGVFYYMNSAKESSELAAAQLSQAVYQSRQGSNQVAILTLNDILSKYGNTKSAEQARFLLGKINLETRNYEEAKLHFTRYLEDFKTNQLNRAASIGGLGVALENQGEYAAAAETFEKGTVEFTGTAMEPELRMGALRNYLQSNQPVKAKVHLDYIQEYFGGTEIAVNAARLYYEKAGPSQ